MLLFNRNLETFVVPTKKAELYTQIFHSTNIGFTTRVPTTIETKLSISWLQWKWTRSWTQGRVLYSSRNVHLEIIYCFIAIDSLYYLRFVCISQSLIFNKKSMENYVYIYFHDFIQYRLKLSIDNYSFIHPVLCTY